MINEDEECTRRRTGFRKRVARIERFKVHQSLANHFVRVGDIIDFHANSQAGLIAQRELRRETWRCFLRSILEGFFEHNGFKQTKPQIRFWSENSAPRRIDREIFESN